MPTLYRKYRPQTFADLVGQEFIVTTITNEIRNDRLAQAYLFSGPRGVGKTTLARLLAKAVNCFNRPADSYEPCEKCSSCQEITAGRNVDVIEIDAASHTQVDHVRENIIANAQFKPTRSRYKVFIIDEVHMLSASSFNALLKTLEEPPAHVIFILATTEPHKLPATVVSRCQRFNFKKIGYDEMLARLKKIADEEKIKVDKEVLGRIINKSDGCLRDAESLLGQIFSLSAQGGSALGGKKITAEDAQMILPSSNVETIITFLDSVVTGECAVALQLINKLTEDGVNLDQFAYDIIEVLRTGLIIKTGGGPARAGQDYSGESLKKIKKIFDALPLPRLIELIDRSLKRRLEIKTAPLPQLPLELLVVEFSSAPPVTIPKSVAAQTSQNQQEQRQPPAPEEPGKTAAHRLTDSIKSALAHITKEEPVTTTLAQIKDRWNEIVEKISATAPSLTFILKMCAVKDLNGNNLRVTIPYSIHKEKMEEHKNKKIIEGFLESFFSEKIHLVCEVAAEEVHAAPATDLSGLAMEFGGEVVN